MALSVRGYFSERRRQPYVVAFRAALPRLGVSTDIHFLVDTGADRTVIHWGDRARLRTADGERLPAAEEFSGRARMTGIEGSAVEYGEETAVLLFRTDQSELVAAAVTACVALTPGSEGIPSLLGRDFLEQVRLDFNMPGDDLTLLWDD